MHDSDVCELRKLLDEERSMLLVGDLQGVAALESRKQDLSERLSRAHRPAAEVLADLQQRAQRNHALFEAARDGLRTAAERLREIRKATRNLDTYTRDGDVRHLPLASSTIERRA